MGTAFCTPLLDRGHEVRLVGTHLDGAYIDMLRATGIHPGLEYPLPPGATFHQIEEVPNALDGAQMLVIGVSSAGISWAARTLAGLVPPGLPLILITKGIEWRGTTFELLPDLLVEGIPETVRPTLHPVAVTGPCVAGELIRRRETCVIFSGRSPSAVRTWRDAASTPYYHVWASADLAACQASAALKNAFAVAVGFASGVVAPSAGEKSGSSELQGVGAHNYESAVFAESIVEMAQLVELVGGAPSAVVGLAGAGDLLVTTHARSIRLGRLLGLGRSLDEALTEMAGVTLEGVATIGAFANAFRTLDASGRTQPEDFPLMRHLIAVANGEPVRVPFNRFFGGTSADVALATGSR